MVSVPRLLCLALSLAQVISATELIVSFQRWVDRVGIRTVCRVEADAFGGFRLMANENIAVGQTFLEIPLQLCFSPILSEDLQHPTRYSGLEWPTQLAIQLLEEKFRPQSLFSPYIQLLPPLERFYALPHNWDEPWLEPWNFPDLLEHHTSKRNFIESEWNNLQAIFEMQGKDDALRWMNIDDFQWAMDCIATRNIRLELGQSKMNALVPMLDFMNHNDQVKSEFFLSSDGRTVGVRYIGGEGVGKDEEVFLNYGRLSALKALRDYGFLPPLNSADSFPVTIPRKLYSKYLMQEVLGTDANSGQASPRPLVLLREMGIQYASPFDIAAQGVPQELLEAMRVLLATADELIEARKLFLSTNRVGRISESNESQVRNAITETLTASTAGPEEGPASPFDSEPRYECAMGMLKRLQRRRRTVLQSAADRLIP